MGNIFDKANPPEG